MIGIHFASVKMTEDRIDNTEPRFTLEQFNLLTRLVSIGERLQQTGLPWDNMFQALYTMQQSYRLGERLPMVRTGPQSVFTYEQLILLTRQLSIHQSLHQTGLSECSILQILCTMQQNKTGNIDIDEDYLKTDNEKHHYGCQLKMDTTERTENNEIRSLEKAAEHDLMKEVDKMMEKNITDMMDLNREIKEFLLKNNICQEAVAADIGTSRSLVSLFLNHGRGLNIGKKRALYTLYLEQKQTKQGLPIHVKEEL
ncbi:uncharacterized protein LOC118410969 [Branchiostoma floridae]|uniref:Uncharacterized protein LOC118410969 n=1 Tax=Branchiostoma floridae TaxID=7739 RepID=A0A9J7KSL7_BRAFL|nr:uncharacterized protein LOC118410969 [Branchiostoma floridae]